MAMDRDRWTTEQLVADLHRLGVAAGDLLMVHASLRAIGPVEGGGAGVVAALEAAIGPGGTLLMTIGAPDDGAPFDAATTPADPDIGVLAEVFRTTPGTVVSDHPEGRFAARGRDAGELVRDVPWDDYYGPGSPLERFVERGGKVLRLGAGVDTTTVIHYAEYQADVPGKRRVRRHPLVARPSGAEAVVVDCLDDSDGIVDHPGPDYFGLILADYLAAGPASRGTVGSAASELLDAADLVRFAAQWMTERFGRLARD
jgi:aminoglycoside N3'-acetyltransferase